MNNRNDKITDEMHDEIKVRIIDLTKKPLPCTIPEGNLTFFQRLKVANNVQESVSQNLGAKWPNHLQYNSPSPSSSVQCSRIKI